jgi:ribose transport system permease protein
MVLGAIFNADGTFFQWATHRDMLRQVSVYGILSCGMTVVIIAGGIDLSVGSILGLCAVAFSLLSIHHGAPDGIAIGGTLLLGTACGLASGGVIARFRVQPFIATLAMMVFARGLAKLISGGEKISTAVQIPDGTYHYVDTPRIFDVISARMAGDNLAVVTVILVVGGNEEAALFAGIPVGLTKLFAYGFCGLTCGIAGICQAAQELQGDPEAGATYELSAIAMVVIGGTSLQGGRGSVWLTLLGVLIIGNLEKILSINAVGEETRLMLTGLIILAAVLFQRGT